MINKIWENKFGDEYHERNKFTEEDFANRMNMWRTLAGAIVSSTASIPNTIMEIGAGNGINLLAINQIYKEAGVGPVELYAVEPNKKACKQTVKILEGVNASVWNASLPNVDIFGKNKMGLVFTSGVLIHVSPDELNAAMKNIYDLSSRFIISIEYYSTEEKEIPYRGEEKALWSRDYGSLWLDNFPLRAITCGFFWKRTTGLDNVTAWVMEKVN